MFLCEEIFFPNIFFNPSLGQCALFRNNEEAAVRIDMGAAAEVCHITQREEELEDLPDELDDLVPRRRLRVQYEHVGGVQGPVGLDAGHPGKHLPHLYVHIRRRPGLAALRKFDLVSVHIIVLTRLRATPDGRVMLSLEPGH